MPRNRPKAVPEYYQLPSQKQSSKPEIRAVVWDMTDGKCWYCGKQTNPCRDFAVDHVIALAQGGKDELENMRPACRTCNQRKCSGSAELFLSSL
jgi:5-methylcytosine-specific restriction protein A